MSLIQRKPRPFTRDPGAFRDDRLFIIACDDTYAPRQYFGFFKIPRIQVHVVHTGDGTCGAAHVLERLHQFEHGPDDERWLLLDADHYTKGPHIKTFMSAIKEASDKGINVAISKPCFELWLLLHHEEEPCVASLSNASEVEAALRSKLGQYNKTNLRESDYPLASVATACGRAERLDKTVAGGEVPASNTSRVYLIWKALAAKAHPTQLPPELQRLT